MENFANVGHVVHVFDIPQGIQNFFGPFGGQGVAGLDTEPLTYLIHSHLVLGMALGIVAGASQYTTVFALDSDGLVHKVAVLEGVEGYLKILLVRRA